MIDRKTKRPLVLLAVMLAMFLAAIEATIVATVMPQIVSDLGGFAHFSWVFSSYLLMQVIMIPIFGSLSDIYGRKLVFTIGIGIFLLGSFLCGLSTSMGMLIVSRFIQGIGAGAVQPIAMTIVGDMYTKEERANIQGYLSSIWGIAAIVGPLLGAFFVEYTEWKWVFWMNLPFGILAIVIISFYLFERVERKEQSVDIVGATYLFFCIGTVMYMLVQFDRATFFFLFLGACLFFLLFLWHERKTSHPILTFSLWKRTHIRYANVASFTAGAMLLSVSTFLPTYVQGVLGKSPLIAGLTLTMTSIGWPLSALIAGRLMLKTSFRFTALLGGIGLMIGGAFFLTLPFLSHPLWAACGSFFLGSGLGFSSTAFIVSIQSTVEWNVRGEATAMNMFMRLLGGAVGVAFLGGILNRRLERFFERQGDRFPFEADVETITTLLDSAEKFQLSNDEWLLLQAGLSTSLSAVFIALFVLAVMSFIFITLLPKEDSTPF